MMDYERRKDGGLKREKGERLSFRGGEFVEVERLAERKSKKGS